MNLFEKYSLKVFYSEDDEGYIATCPEFEGLSAFGETRTEALEEATIALKGFIETYAEEQRELPAPYKEKEFSGQLRIRLPKSLHARLSHKAKEEGVSLNMLLVQCIESGLTKQTLNKDIKNFISSKIAQTGVTFLNTGPGFMTTQSTLMSGEQISSSELISSNSLGPREFNSYNIISWTKSEPNTHFRDRMAAGNENLMLTKIIEGEA